MTYRVFASWSPKRSSCADAETPDAFIEAIGRAAALVDYTIDSLVQRRVERLWPARHESIFTPIVARNLDRARAERVVQSLEQSGVAAKAFWDGPVFYLLRTVRFRTRRAVFAQALLLLLAGGTVSVALWAGAFSAGDTKPLLSAGFFVGLYLLADVGSWWREPSLAVRSQEGADGWDGQRLSIARERGTASLDVVTFSVCVAVGVVFIGSLIRSAWGWGLAVVGGVAAYVVYFAERRSRGFRLQADDELFRIVLRPGSPEPEETSGRVADIIAIDRRAMSHGDTTTEMRIHLRDAEPVTLLVSPTDWEAICTWREALSGYVPTPESSPSPDDLPRLSEPLHQRVWGGTGVIEGNDDCSFALLHRRASNYHAGYSIASISREGEFVLTTDRADKKSVEHDRGLVLAATRDFDSDLATHRRAFEMLYGEHVKLTTADIPDVDPDVLERVVAMRTHQYAALLGLLVLVGGLVWMGVYVGP